MASVDVLDPEGRKAGSVELPAHLFEAGVSQYAVHRAVVAHEANQRQGNASVKGRGEVCRSGRKHHRQKGTGQARRGAVTTNLLRGGGVAFGLPKPRSHRMKLNHSLKRQALRSALTAKSREGRVAVVEGFRLERPSTRSFAAMLAACGLEGRKVLFITADHEPTLVKSGRNITGVQIRTAGTVGTYDVVAAGTLLVARDAIDALARVHGAGGAEAA